MKKSLKDHILQDCNAFQPQVGLILGSGLGSFADDCMDVRATIPYADIDGFPESTAPGHKGKLVLGTVGETPVACFQGRFHLYEGYTAQQVTQPLRELAACGIKQLVVTNAAGGIREDMAPGDFMLISDHINMQGTNPLIGPCGDGLTRFPDMTEVYSSKLRKLAADKASALGISLNSGVYVAVTGPSFETPAEICAFRALGADAVGMSTAPEAIVARQLSIETLGISLISNKAAGLSDTPLTAEEVFETADRVRPDFMRLLVGIIEDL